MKDIEQVIKDTQQQLKDNFKYKNILDLINSKIYKWKL